MANDLKAILPADFAEGRFLGRAMAPEGPVVISIRDGVIYDLTTSVASVAGAIARREFDGGTVIGPVAWISMFSTRATAPPWASLRVTSPVSASESPADSPSFFISDEHRTVNAAMC